MGYIRDLGLGLLHQRIRVGGLLYQGLRVRYKDSLRFLVVKHDQGNYTILRVKIPGNAYGTLNEIEIGRVNLVQIQQKGRKE